ncbi:hypothetical protein ALQ04_03460 [Pseudomonas cichorii]|uniref:Halovibrin n=1 Tax=Pseudomonas cichorii TaxID=36746 RepID=A0A3M4M7H1_PSECI|nr:hypothetical protein [Pseudomonas cichorii]RMQ49509.1 hypothetical protein ALQ04_03460 [Pseudomonas cichorii]
MKTTALFINAIASLLFFACTQAQAISGPQTVQLLNNRYQSTATTCGSDKPAWQCNGVLVQPATREAGQKFWQHDTDAVALGAEELVYLRRDLGIRQLEQPNGVIFSDLFTAVGNGKTLEVLCAYPFASGLNSARGNYGCALPASPASPSATSDASSCKALGITGVSAWLTHFEQQGNQPEQQCSLSSLEPLQFKASLEAHELLGSEWSARANQLQLRNWDPTLPQEVPVQALFYDTHQNGSLSEAQKDQRDYFNATGEWLPTVRMDLQDSSGKVFGFNLADQLYVGYGVAQAMNKRYADARPQCPDARASYYCNGVLFRSNQATSAFHAWDASPGSIANNGVSFSYARSDIIINMLAYNRPYGFTFKALNAPATYPPTLRCAYPYDAATSGSPDPCTFRGQCEAMGVTTVAAWAARYQAYPYSSCAFGPGPEQFQLSIDVRQSLPANLYWNEIMMAAWPRNIPKDLPLEAFFYEKNSGGLLQAQFIQNDYFQQTQRFLPIVEMNLGATDGQVFSYDPASQLAPGAPSPPSRSMQSSPETPPN